MSADQQKAAISAERQPAILILGHRNAGPCASAVFSGVEEVDAGAVGVVGDGDVVVS
jgi:hypothetical protein